MKCGKNIVLYALRNFFCSSSLIFNLETFLALWQTWVGWPVTPVWCMVHSVTEPLPSSLRVLPLIPTVVRASHTYKPYLYILLLMHLLNLPFSPSPAERYWEMIDRLKITHLYTIPTVMKFLMKAGDEHVEKYRLSSLKVLGLGNQPLGIIDDT